MTCQPIFKLLKKNSPKKWNGECQEAFEKVKQCLSLPPVLLPVIPGQPLLLYLSIIDTTTGFMLAQQDAGSKKERLIYYISKKMLEYEMKYTILEKTCLALVWATQRLRHYLLSNKKSIKRRVIAEQLADAPVEENAFLKAEFPDEEIMELEDETPSTRWLMYFDGAVNNRGQGVGAVLVSPKKEYILLSIKLQFECTNNMAEYEACIVGHEAALALRVQDIDVFGDSILIICQINGRWRTRETRLISYNTYLESLVKKFRSITFTHLSMTRNHFADALATLASMLDIYATMEVQPLAVRLQSAPTHVNAMEISARCPNGKPWYTDIRNLISGKGYPSESSSKERKTLQRVTFFDLAMAVLSMGNRYYWKNLSKVLERT
ncbi:uncharacterized protein LOC143889192 [Tasmannia lanceolata]|uniref:uncharacterized protein LOC143889192 n=1 Tax=Tasmannia lanceolata TaxID=3420 RepID=UPI004062E120